MKSILFFILFAPLLLYAQKEPCATLFDKTQDCSQSLLGKLISRDTDLVWEKIFTKEVEFETAMFRHFEEHMEEQTSTPGLLSKHKKVFLVSTVGFKNNDNKQKAIEIYEITFGSSTMVEAALSKINAAKICYVEWPDASIPVRFYNIKKKLFVFCNSSDDHDEPWAEQWFNPIVEKLILKLEAL